MCLDAKVRLEDRGKALEVENNQNLVIQQNLGIESELSSMDSSLKVNNLCGGSLIDHKPIFNPNGE
jgi:hypothetical protein